MAQENQKKVTIPYIAHESEIARMERQHKRLWIALLSAIAALVICNLAWLWYIYQYDFESYEYTQDGEGVNVIGDNNEVANGTESEGAETYPEER